jgi:hypothetical protein
MAVAAMAVTAASTVVFAAVHPYPTTARTCMQTAHSSRTLGRPLTGPSLSPTVKSAIVVIIALLAAYLELGVTARSVAAFGPEFLLDPDVAALSTARVEDASQH